MEDPATSTSNPGSPGNSGNARRRGSARAGPVVSQHGAAPQDLLERIGCHRRALLARATGTLSAGLLAACRPGGPAATPAGAPAAQAPVTIRHLARGSDAYLRLQKELRDAFQERSPSITVEIDDSPGDWHQKLVTQAASGSPPDAIFECDCALGSDVRQGLVEQLDPWLARDKRFKADAYYDVSWYASTYPNPNDGLALAHGPGSPPEAGCEMPPWSAGASWPPRSPETPQASCETRRRPSILSRQ